MSDMVHDTVRGEGTNDSCARKWLVKKVCPPKRLWDGNRGGGTFTQLLLPKGTVRRTQSLITGKKKHRNSLQVFSPQKSLSGLPEAAGLRGSFCCLPFPGERKRESKGRRKEE